jgi:hypothetical protein
MLSMMIDNVYINSHSRRLKAVGHVIIGKRETGDEALQPSASA